MKKDSQATRLREAAQLRHQQLFGHALNIQLEQLPADLRFSIEEVINGPHKTFRYMLITDNQGICTAHITMAAHPVMRASPYAGMLFNGLGRPIDLERPCQTLPASMGGNKTPYFRRITVSEAAALQGFPSKFKFCGSQCDKYRQIGNSVPPPFAERIARSVMAAGSSHQRCHISVRQEGNDIMFPIRGSKGVRCEQLDEAVKALLAIALGVTPKSRRRSADNGLRKFRGTLSASSADSLLRHVENASFSKVDPDDL